ncbi:MAG TPA: hypothetical protein VFJ58_13620, partial [Armatimonadota bacterium]|nr:hypothetical protein [Armatimonadota bacterium]
MIRSGAFGKRCAKWLAGLVMLGLTRAAVAAPPGSVASALQQVSQRRHLVIVVGADRQALNRPVSMPSGKTTASSLDAAAAVMGAHWQRFDNVVVFPREIPMDCSRASFPAKSDYMMLSEVMSVIGALPRDTRDPKKQLSWSFTSFTPEQQRGWKRLFARFMGTTDGQLLSKIWDRPDVEQKMAVSVMFDVDFGFWQPDGLNLIGTFQQLPERRNRAQPVAPVPWKSTAEEDTAFADSGSWALPDPAVIREQTLKSIAATKIPALSPAIGVETKTARDWMAAISKKAGLKLDVDARIAAEPISLIGAPQSVSASDLLAAVGLAADSGSAWRRIHGLLFLSAQRNEERCLQALLKPGTALDQQLTDLVFRLYPD